MQAFMFGAAIVSVQEQKRVRFINETHCQVAYVSIRTSSDTDMLRAKSTCHLAALLGARGDARRERCSRGSLSTSPLQPIDATRHGLQHKRRRMMMKATMRTTIWIMTLCWLGAVQAFQPTPSVQTSLFKTSSSSSLSMAPRFDKSTQKWIPTSDAEMPSAGYDIWGTLLRQGPKPFVSRLVNPGEYEQAILKLMAGDKIPYIEAQASMDAFLENPNDWAYDRFNNPGRDYLTLNKKAILLTLVWSTVVVSAVGRAAYAYTNHVGFYDFLSQ